MPRPAAAATFFRGALLGFAFALALAFGFGLAFGLAFGFGFAFAFPFVFAMAHSTGTIAHVGAEHRKAGRSFAARAGPVPRIALRMAARRGAAIPRPAPGERGAHAGFLFRG